jgi:hypothetical protein
MKHLSETVMLNSRSNHTYVHKVRKLNRATAKSWLVYNQGPNTVTVLEHRSASPVHAIEVKSAQAMVFHFNPVVLGNASKVTLSVTY